MLSSTLANGFTDRSVDAVGTLSTCTDNEGDQVPRQAVSWLKGPLATTAGDHFGWWDADRVTHRVHRISHRGPLWHWSPSRRVIPTLTRHLQTWRWSIFSPMHDDVMDRDARRGRVTLSVVLGQHCAIILRDVLHVSAGGVSAKFTDPGGAAGSHRAGGVLLYCNISRPTSPPRTQEASPCHHRRVSTGVPGHDSKPHGVCRHIEGAQCRRRLGDRSRDGPVRLQLYGRYSKFGTIVMSS